jgi:hypothetical protein
MLHLLIDGTYFENGLCLIIITITAFNMCTPLKKIPMLTEDKIIGICCLIDDILKGIGHQELFGEE